MTQQDVSPEELARMRRVIAEADRAERFVEVSFERTNPDGSRMSMNIPRATPEQAALVAWLQAEDAWKRNQGYREREAARKRQEQIERDERAVRVQKAKAEHGRLMRSAVGFRHAALVRHRPVDAADARGPRLLCHECDDGEYEPESLPFPCPEYVFARDWSGA